MENKDLHAQKVTILSRLIKESSLTFEEALLILKEEEPKQPSVQFLNSSTGTAYHVPNLGTWSTTGVPTFLSMSGGTSSIINTIADDSADLNN